MSYLYLTRSSPPSMTQSNNHHRRTSSGSNVPKLRNSRPALHRRGTSFVNHSISKLGSGQVTKQLELDDDRQPEMAASFLNFWYVLCYILVSSALPSPQHGCFCQSSHIPVNLVAYSPCISNDRLSSGSKLTDLQRHVRKTDNSA